MTFILHDIWHVIRNPLTNFHIFRSAMLLVARELYTVAVVHGLELLSGAVLMAPKFSTASVACGCCSKTASKKSPAGGKTPCL